MPFCEDADLFSLLISSEAIKVSSRFLPPTILAASSLEKVVLSIAQRMFSSSISAGLIDYWYRVTNILPLSASALVLHLFPSCISLKSDATGVERIVL